VSDKKRQGARRPGCAVRFDEEAFEELSREAREQGIGLSTLARMHILEHIRARSRSS